jgi:Homeodomain-like domain
MRAVLALRRLRYNGWRIARELGLSRATVSRILCRAGLSRLRSLDPPPPVVRYEHKRPGDLIHFDIKRLARIVKPGHRVHGDRTRRTTGAGYEYLHIAIDDHSRISFAAILADQMRSIEAEINRRRNEPMRPSDISKKNFRGIRDS